MHSPDDSSTETRRLLDIRRLWMRRWWLSVLGLWVTVGAASLWGLRRTWSQLSDYFTWAALRYGLGFNRLPALGLGLCVGLTVALLVKESRFLLYGLSKKERGDLEKALAKKETQH